MANFFMPTEKNLVLDPITGSPKIGKNVDNYSAVDSHLMSEHNMKNNENFYNRLKFYK